MFKVVLIYSIYVESVLDPPGAHCNHRANWGEKAIHLYI